MSDLLTVGEVARIFRVDDTTVRRWCAKGAIEAHELPRSGNGIQKKYRIKRRTVTDILGETSPLF